MKITKRARWPAFFFAALLITAAPAFAGPPMMTHYESARYKFSIDLPSIWQIRENYMGTAVIAIGPLDNSMDEFRENVNVVRETLPRFMSMDEYMKISIQNMARVLTIFEKEDTGRWQTGSGEAAWVLYTHRQGKYYIRGLAVVYMKGNQAYVITNTAESDRFLRYRSLFEFVSKSFRMSP